MIRHSFINIKNQYVNLDKVEHIYVDETKSGFKISFCYNGNSIVKFWFDSHQKNLFNKAINGIEKKLITNIAQISRSNADKKPNDLDEVIDYFKKLKIVEPEKNAEQFYNYYETNNWYRGKTRIVKWKSCVKTWKFDRETDEEDTTFEERLEARRAFRKRSTRVGTNPRKR
tara:strand:+ start:2048 stop:2560 length:513 start_codon:yes stop_codon:yes gene_type:complete